MLCTYRIFFYINDFYCIAEILQLSGHDVLSKMTTTMLDVECQQLIHQKISVLAVNVLRLECVKVIMQITIDNDEVVGIPQWLLC